MRAVSESFACTWDSLPSIGLLHPALALGDVLSLTAAWHAIFGWYPSETCIFLKRNGREVDLEEKEVRRRHWEEKLWFGSNIWEKNKLKNLNENKVRYPKCPTHITYLAFPAHTVEKLTVAPCFLGTWKGAGSRNIVMSCHRLTLLFCPHCRKQKHSMQCPVRIDFFGTQSTCNFFSEAPKTVSSANISISLLIVRLLYLVTTLRVDLFPADTLAYHGKTFQKIPQGKHRWRNMIVTH